MTLKRRLGVLEVRKAEDEQAGERARERLGSLIKRHLSADTLPLRAQEVLCKAIRRKGDAPPRVLEALLASPELGEEHKLFLRQVRHRQ